MWYVLLILAVVFVFTILRMDYLVRSTTWRNAHSNSRGRAAQAMEYEENGRKFG